MIIEWHNAMIPWDRRKLHEHLSLLGLNSFVFFELIFFFDRNIVNLKLLAGRLVSALEFQKLVLPIFRKVDEVSINSVDGLFPAELEGKRGMTMCDQRHDIIMPVSR